MRPPHVPLSGLQRFVPALGGIVAKIGLRVSHPRFTVTLHAPPPERQGGPPGPAQLLRGVVYIMIVLSAL